MSKENQAMLKSWVKTALAAGVAVYLAGGRDVQSIIQAAVVAVLPVIYAWLDPSDKRFGRVAEVSLKKKAATKKK